MKGKGPPLFPILQWHKWCFISKCQTGMEKWGKEERNLWLQLSESGTIVRMIKEANSKGLVCPLINANPKCIRCYGVKAVNMSLT